MNVGRAHLLVGSLAAVAASLVALLLAVQHRADAPAVRSRAAASDAAGAVEGPGDPLAVLRGWDRRRSAAWAAGDPAALRRLYTRGSAAGERDVRLLERYLDRGLRVRGMGVQVLAVDVRRSDGDVLGLVVTDRLVGAVATGRGLRVRLPEDEPSRHLVTLRRSGSQWRVSEVREG
ncbi:MAG: hypothetical protein U0R80_07650 [Nocardioidaceae bacterium]